MSDEKLFMHIEGIKMNYSFDYKVWTEPGHEWINQSEKGNIEIKFDGLEMAIGLAKTKKNALKLDFDSIVI